MCIQMIHSFIMPHISSIIFRKFWKTWIQKPFPRFFRTKIFILAYSVSFLCNEKRYLSLLEEQTFQKCIKYNVVNEKWVSDAIDV
jgi:hypothetical protein